MENKTEWEAEFKMNGKEYSANFDTDGNWLETEYEIAESEIPEAVKATLDNEFKAYKVKESELSETAKGKVYEFELTQGKEEIEVAINADGTVIKKEQAEEKDGDNE